MLINHVLFSLTKQTGLDCLKFISLIFTVAFISSSCGEGTNNTPAQTGEPLNPEELGYYREFNNTWERTFRYSDGFLESALSVQKNIDTGQSKDSNSYQEDLRDWRKEFGSLKDLSDEQLEHLNIVAPPDSMQNLHSAWLELLQDAQTVEYLADLEPAVRNFMIEHSNFSQEFSNRPKRLTDDGPFTVAFQPVASPITFSANLQSWQIGIEFSQGLVTPIGEFQLAAGAESTTEITELVIQHAGMIRYATLTPGSKIFVHASCGIFIEQAEPRLVLNVPECNSTQTQPAMPKDSCGDPLPTDPSVYPINFYPVFIDYSESNLTQVRELYCKDAFSMTRKSTGKRAIQVASFIDEIRAIEFQDSMKASFGSSEIGTPKRWDNPPD